MIVPDGTTPTLQPPYKSYNRFLTTGLIQKGRHMPNPGKKSSLNDAALATPPKPPCHGKKNTKLASYSESMLQEAIEACNPDNPVHISIAKAARTFHIPETTLRNRIKGCKSRSEAREPQQKLTKIQETVLALYCQNKGWRNDPLSIEALREAASIICGEPVGRDWHLQFERRHPEIRIRNAKPGESKRGKGNIQPYNIYNMDEKGLQECGGTVRRRVVVDAKQKDPKFDANEARKMITVVECISADGVAIAPLLIHQGAEKDGEWVRSNPCRAA